MIPTTSARTLLRERPPGLRADLEKLSASLHREISGGERELATPLAAGDAGIAHGAAADLYDRELRLTEVTAFKEELLDVDAALGRMAAGTYGRCVDCGRPIPLDRLVARPQTERDIDCERAIERERSL